MSYEENTFTVIPPFRLKYSIVVVVFKSLGRWQRVSPPLQWQGRKKSTLFTRNYRIAPNTHHGQLTKISQYLQNNVFILHGTIA